MFFEKLLADQTIGKTARAYLQERGFNEASVKNFHIGLAVDAWDALLKSPLMKAFPPPVLAAAGLVKTRESGSGFYDTFRDRLMFPIRDENGRVIAFGGRVMRAAEPVHGKTSAIHHRGTDVFAGLPDPFTATRYHSLIVQKSSLPDCLTATAFTEDGIIMGLRHETLPIFGVQFHPESTATSHGHEILANFLAIARHGAAPPA